jgi:hypothetical protein
MIPRIVHGKNFAVTNGTQLSPTVDRMCAEYAVVCRRKRKKDRK